MGVRLVEGVSLSSEEAQEGPGRPRKASLRLENGMKERRSESCRLPLRRLQVQNPSRSPLA